jgi:hypothetical protein
MALLQNTKRDMRDGIDNVLRQGMIGSGDGVFCLLNAGMQQ